MLLQGVSLHVPGDVFQEPNTSYEAVIKGWNGKKTHELICKFNDGTQVKSYMLYVRCGVACHGSHLN
jgi:hypothetical protein